MRLVRYIIYSPVTPKNMGTTLSEWAPQRYRTLNAGTKVPASALHYFEPPDEALARFFAPAFSVVNLSENPGNGIPEQNPRQTHNVRSWKKPKTQPAAAF